MVSSLWGLGQSYEIELDEKVNPNDAPLGSLVRLPGIGIGKAGAIVDCRGGISRKNSNNPAFQDCNDLQKVSGIGAKTAQSICEWLKFE
ncbi:MAG: ComEA family DNA-binding protein [Planctomycetota bacterium]